MKKIKIGLQILLYVISHGFNSSVFQNDPLQYILVGFILTSTYLLWKEASIDILCRSIMIICILEGLIIYGINASNINLQETIREYITQNWALPIIILSSLIIMLLKKIIKKLPNNRNTSKSKNNQIHI
jgi:hypothetical protein